MRITGGLFRGRRLQVPVGREVRPTTDKVRQAIFNILVHEIPEARVLDLFAGSGALGIEAVSRGAESAVFVEKHNSALNCLKRNLAEVKLDARVLEDDWLDAIQQLIARQERFDLIFADPPYGMLSGDAIAEAVVGREQGVESALLAPDGILIIEGSAQDEPVTILRTLKERVFDTTRISFYAR